MSEWVMVTVLSDQRKVSLFGSSNLRGLASPPELDFLVWRVRWMVYGSVRSIRLLVENSRGEERWMPSRWM
jgi:hypothetical protein